MNWERGFDEGISVIKKYKKNKKLPAAIGRDSLFRLHISFGEEYLLYKKRRKAIGQFFKAWGNKPLSIVPFKKTGKAILKYFH